MQVDLGDYFFLKCIRIPIRSTTIWSTANFEDLQFRFGNKSQGEEFTENPVIIDKTESGQEDTIFEFCLSSPFGGRYLLIHEKRSANDYIIIGEIQILIE